jgi:hypothetical protein
LEFFDINFSGFFEICRDKKRFLGIFRVVIGVHEIFRMIHPRVTLFVFVVFSSIFLSKIEPLAAFILEDGFPSKMGNSCDGFPSGISMKRKPSDG